METAQLITELKRRLTSFEYLKHATDFDELAWLITVEKIDRDNRNSIKELN